MAELFVFTLLATIVAIYGVLPKYRQHRVGYCLGNKLGIGVLSIFGAVILLGYVGGLILQNTDRETLGTLNTGYISIEITRLTVEIAQLSAVLAIVGIFVGVFVRENVRIRNEQYLLSTLRDLYNRDEYGTLVDVIRDNYVPLIDHPAKPTAPGNESWAEVLSSVEEIEEGEAADRRSPVLEYVIEEAEDRAPDGQLDRAREMVSFKRQQAEYWFSRLRYRLSDTAEDATGYTESLLLSPEFAAKHPILNPELGIDVISDDSLEGFHRREFTNQYLTTMLNTENSLLYRDIENNMGGRGVYRYRIDPDNRLIYSLLSDCSRAEELDVYNPIGATTKKILRDQGKQDHDKYHDQQLTTSNNSDNYIFSDPVYVAITFFDIMVSESLYQRISWHMFLYNYDSFTRLICENYEITDESDPVAEWPNDYSRFLYEMVSNMTDWLKAMEKMVLEDECDVMVKPDVERDDENKGQEDTDVANDARYADFIRLDSIDTHRGTNIPKSTVICLFSCHRRIMTTEEIPDQFKEYITNIIFQCCVDLRKHDEDTLPWQYTELMLHCIEENINDRRSASAYHRALETAYNSEVRHEVLAKSLTGGNLVEELDDLIR
ncbi:hypothetical protein [Haloferax sp. KTX1]|uniref:hypothetical protein n=1 Tax=Haloferax sp. KTX1 TaxID=2600597 RepID=UPI0011DDC2EA|nr:hypothetical protein [Haloferax sp. KTX1]